MAEFVEIPEDVAQVAAPNVLLISPDGSICNDLTLSFLLVQIIYQLDRLNQTLDPQP